MLSFSVIPDFHVYYHSLLVMYQRCNLLDARVASLVALQESVEFLRRPHAGTCGSTGPASHVAQMPQLSDCVSQCESQDHPDRSSHAVSSSAAVCSYRVVYLATVTWRSARRWSWKALKKRLVKSYVAAQFNTLKCSGVRQLCLSVQCHPGLTYIFF